MGIPFVEKEFDCNIYVVDLNELPILGSSIKLWNCLMYKTENKNKNHYFLLYDDNLKHYDAITDIKAFLACRCFCYKCLSSFTDGDAFKNHSCVECKHKVKRTEKNKGKMLKELSHYLD
jgi:hypothetical protein